MKPVGVIVGVLRCYVGVLRCTEFLKFLHKSVEFSLTMQMVLDITAPTRLRANAPNPAVPAANDSDSSEQSTKESEPTQLANGTVRVCVDDDKASGMMSNAIIRLPGLNADQTNSIVFGETLQEVQGLVQTVMDIAAQVGEGKAICILDQMLDCGTDMFLMTDATAGLCSLGFKGVVLIRSANDEHFARELYQDAGASGFLGKSVCRAPEIAKSIVSRCHNAS